MYFKVIPNSILTRKPVLKSLKLSLFTFFAMFSAVCSLFSCLNHYVSLLCERLWRNVSSTKLITAKPKSFTSSSFASRSTISWWSFDNFKVLWFWGFFKDYFLTMLFMFLGTCALVQIKKLIYFNGFWMFIWRLDFWCFNSFGSVDKYFWNNF